MIKLHDIHKIYRSDGIECVALNGVSLEIPKGEFTSIVGRSGSGKSTLMHIIGMIDTPTSGTVEINGQNIAELNKKQQASYRNKTVGFVFQTFFLEPTYTVFKNVEMPLLIAGVPKSKRKERIEKALEAVGLSDKAKNSANKLSGGEKQRVSIARALVNDSPVILADEPCGNLDSKNSENIMSILRTLAQQGKTVVLVTHNQSDAEKTDRIITILDGRVCSDEKL